MTFSVYASNANFVCTSCGHGFNGVPTRSFLGFLNFKCPSCRVSVTYPLTPGYRTTYWVLLTFIVLAIIATLSQGQVAFPGGLGIAVAVALLLDRRIRERVRVAIERPPGTPSPSLSKPASADKDFPSAPSVYQKAQGAAPATTQQPNPVVMRPENPAPVPAVAATPRPTPSILAEEEELWASALAEFKGDARRPGLWAKCFSEANGNELIAQATYLRVRVSQLSVTACYVRRSPRPDCI